MIPIMFQHEYAERLDWMEEHKKNKQRIILIGPCGAGKSTVGRLLATALEYRFVDLDSVREEIYKATDYSEEAAADAYKTNGVFGWYEYIKPYEFYSVKSGLSDPGNAVIAFGGGQSVYDDTVYEEPFLRMMRNEQNVFLLLPSEDEQESLRILNSRVGNEDERILRFVLLILALSSEHTPVPAHWH